MDDSEAVQVRFRHTAGDLGPFQFSESASVQSLKDRVFAEWPKGTQRSSWAHSTPIRRHSGAQLGHTMQTAYGQRSLHSKRETCG